MHYENRLICKRMCCEMYTIKKRKIAKQEQKEDQPNNASNYKKK